MSDNNDTPQPKTSPRRFIAGAKCPVCGLEDKIVMYRIGEQKFYECVKCGHKEAEARLDASKPKTVAQDAAAPLEQVLSFHPRPPKNQ